MRAPDTTHRTVWCGLWSRRPPVRVPSLTLFVPANHALKLRRVVFERMRETMTTYDVLAAPVSQVAPFTIEVEWPTEVASVGIGFYTDWFRSCSRLTVTSHPAVSVPGGFIPGGLPIGLQLIGRHRGDATLLGFAAAFEAATRFGARRPPR